MSAHDNLNETQFGPYRISYDPAGDNTSAIRAGGYGNQDDYHSLVARDDTGYEVGSIAWAKPGKRRLPGEIGYVHTHDDYRHQGIATALFNAAKDSGVRPSPKHSSQRTDDGDAWSKSVGGRRPRRDMR